MTLRAYLLFMGVGTLLAWIAWAIVLINVDPFESGPAGFVFFFVTLAVGLVGTLTIALVGYRVGLLRKAEMVSREVKVSFRHALLLTTVAVTSLILSSQGLLHVWVLVVLILCAGVLEYLSLLVQRSRRG